MSITKPSIDELAKALNCAHPELDDEAWRLIATAYDSLAEGNPVTDAELAGRMGADEAWVRSTLGDWPGVFRNDEGRITAFWGLALEEMGHRLHARGRNLYTWCAFDPLFIGPAIDSRARVSSTCPVTGEEITLTISDEGLRDLDPRGAVISFLAPSERWGDDVIERFCHYVLLFASAQAGQEWVGSHPGTFLMSVDEAFELARRAFGRLRRAGTKR